MHFLLDITSQHNFLHWEFLDCMCPHIVVSSSILFGTFRWNHKPKELPTEVNRGHPLKKNRKAKWQRGKPYTSNS